jgi:hypothetical protein
MNKSEYIVITEIMRFLTDLLSEADEEIANKSKKSE